MREMNSCVGWVATLVAVVGLGWGGAGEDVMLEMPDLGRRLGLGDLYDARTHQQVSGRLWPQALVDEMKATKPAQSSRYEFAYDDRFSDKIKMMDLGLDFAMSFMGGDVKVDGAARYLTNKKTTSHAVRMSMMHRLRTVKETVDSFHDRMMTGKNLKVLADGHATHVVTGVTYGAETVCTFERDFSSKEEGEQVSVFLRLGLLLNESRVDVGVNVTVNSTEQEILDQTKVYLAGDILLPTDRELPTRPHEALKLMRQMHQFSLGGDGKGVGMTLELTPLAWIYDAAAKLVTTISADLVERAVAVYESLDRSEELVLDLMGMDEGAFRAWKDDVEGYYQGFLRYRTQFAQNLSHAVSQRRNGLVETEGLVAVMESYWNSTFGDVAVAQAVEEKRDTLLNLQALVEQMRRWGVTMARTYSDYQAPTFDSTYDKVYALVIVGMIPSSDREGIARVREFTALAEARRTDLLRREGVMHCVTRQPEGADRPVCVERLKFVAVHFDSFCEEFCPTRYCAPAGQGVACPMTRTCTVAPGIAERLHCWERTAGCNAGDPRQAYTAATPLQDCWCACPRTQVLEFASSQAPIRADALPVVPGRPRVDGVDGADAAEEHPLDQRVVLRLNAADVLGVVRNFRVRVLWHEASAVEGESRLEWVQRERVVETRDDNRTIVVSGLASGQGYRFEVGGVNSVGEGPYSVGFPADGDLFVSHNRPIFTPRGLTTRHEAVPLNVLPGWRTFNGDGHVPVSVALSTPAREAVADIEFHAFGAAPDAAPLFVCEGVGAGTPRGAECSVPVELHPVGPAGEVLEARVRGVSGDLLAWGNVTLQGPSARACYDWENERWLLCDTEVASVSGADDLEPGPLHQEVTLTLNGSTHVRDLLRYRVRASWKEAGVAEEQELVFDTNTDSRTILVMGLAAGRTYQFQVAGIMTNGAVGPYSYRYPQTGVRVGHAMPVVTPAGTTHHESVPQNRVPAWFFNNTGKMRVNVGMSVAADEPVARLTVHRKGQEAASLECAAYGEARTTGTSCTLAVSRLPTGSGEMEVRVWGVNNGMVGKAVMWVETPSEDSCLVWEPTKRLFCDLAPSGGVQKCVEKCEDCEFNGQTTSEFSGTCSVEACPGNENRTFCPDTQECFNTRVGDADGGCRSLCSGDTQYRWRKGVCAVPCELKRLGVEVPPGAGADLLCVEGWRWTTGPAPKAFTCPADNAGRLEIEENGRVASWAVDPSELDCRECTQSDCNGHASAISSTPDRTKCTCTCSSRYQGETCDACAPGHISYPHCYPCTNAHCNGHAESVTTDGGQTKCVCNCLERFTGERCDICKVGYFGDSCTKCTVQHHCNGNAYSATTDFLRSRCVCNCRTGYEGANCNKCERGYTGYPFCRKCRWGTLCFLTRDFPVIRPFA